MTYNIFITGGTGGIGHAIARKFANHPLHTFNILIISRDSHRARNAVAKLAHRGDQKHSYVVGDINKLGFWESFAKSCGSKSSSSPMAGDDGHTHRASILRSTALGPSGEDFEEKIPFPNVFINAAGFVHSGPFIRSSDEMNTELINTNLVGTMRACRYMAKPLRSSSKHSGNEITPSILNISSVLANIGGDGVVAYAAAKAGILGLTRALAVEYGQLGIRVNSLLPGFINTDMTKSTDSSKLLKKIPLGRLGSPDEVADAALFLALNNYAHNCALTLDGGLSASGSLVD